MKPKLTDEQIEKMALEEHPIDGSISTLTKRYSFKKGARQAREIYEGEDSECKHEWNKLERISPNGFSCECGEELYSFTNYSTNETTL